MDAGIIQAMRVSNRTREDNFRPYRQLACEVINIALSDLTAVRITYKGKIVVDHLERARAQSFLEDPILEMWADAAGVAVDRIRKRAAEIISERDSR